MFQILTAVAVLLSAALLATTLLFGFQNIMPLPLAVATRAISGYAVAALMFAFACWLFLAALVAASRLPEPEYEQQSARLRIRLYRYTGLALMVLGAAVLFLILNAAD